MKNNLVRYGFCKIDYHKASYAGHFESKKHLEKITQSIVNLPRKKIQKSKLWNRILKYFIPKLKI